MQLKFLITGCHGDLAFSIAQIIKKNFKKAKILGTDIETNGIGNVIFDEIYKVPRVNSSRYFDEILKISKSVNLIIPSTEKEIVFFSKNKKKFKSKILMNNEKIINLFLSKLKTQRFLRKNFYDFSLKLSLKLSDYSSSKKIPLPFFLKKISGSGNQNYKIVKNKTDLKNLNFYNKKDWVIEELLDPSTEEYTSAIIRLKNIKKILIFKRKLHKLGHTLYAETFHNLEIEKKLVKIADKLNLNGALNIQFKIQKNQIKIFDINARLSSTVKMRDLIGFHDCLWWIQEKLKIPNKSPVNIKKNKILIKYFNEKVIN
jgi:carbamoyl-phosphate synthase large subunit